MDNEKVVVYINSLENKLSYIEKKYKAIINNIKCVIFQTDKAGLWIFLTPIWMDFTGFSPDESMGNSFLDYIYSDDQDIHHKNFLVVIQGKKKYSRYEIRYCTKSGELRWAEIYIRSMTDKDENIIGTLGTLHDITDRKQTENMLHFFYELRRRSDLLNDIITGSTKVNETISSYMKILGIDLSQPVFCCLLMSKGFSDKNKEKNFIIEILSENKKSVVWDCKNNIGVLCQGVGIKEENDTLSLAFAKFLLKKVKIADSQLPVTIGISNAQTGIDSLRKVYLQAWSATIAAQCHGKGLEEIYHYKDLGILQLLIRNMENESSDEFIREQLGKLITYDQ